MDGTGKEGDAVDLDLWKQELRSRIERFEERSESLLGYPVTPGANVVTDSSGIVPPDLPEGLAELYRAVDEVSLENIHNGYFIHPPDSIAKSVAHKLPVRADTDELTGPVVTFASDGGGTLYCVAVDSGAVWELPEGEVTEAGVYRGGLDAPRLIATSVEEFLGKLLAAVDQFIETRRADL